jgi:glycerophosphoryl diester phosphodiesterase
MQHLVPHALFVFAALAALGAGSVVAAKTADPIVIGHRGAAGYRPEHTLAGYQLALDMGADFVEPDLVSTKDGVLVCRHENNIIETTNVATHPEFASFFKTKTVDGVTQQGWFTEDFTLAQLKTLRAKERLPLVRPANTVYDGLFEVPTLQEVIDLVKRGEKSRKENAVGRRANARIGIYPETKHPTYFRGIGLPLEDRLLDVLDKNGYRGPDSPCFIQSFESANLRYLATRTRIPLVQLLDAAGKPWDFVVAGDARTYADLATAAGLAFIATYAQGVGVNKSLIIPRNAAGFLLPPTNLVRDAHAVGLIVHGWTFRVENQFLPADFRIGADPNAHGDLEGEIAAFLAVGMDGFFTDNADIGVAARDAFVE